MRPDMSKILKWITNVHPEGWHFDTKPQTIAKSVSKMMAGLQILQKVLSPKSQLSVGLWAGAIRSHNKEMILIGLLSVFLGLLNIIDSKPRIHTR